ncbi:MAG: hypothetical protein ACJ76I_07045 [Gaiellaceae bacterium]
MKITARQRAVDRSLRYAQLVGDLADGAVVGRDSHDQTMPSGARSAALRPTAEASNGAKPRG